MPQSQLLLREKFGRAAGAENPRIDVPSSLMLSRVPGCMRLQANACTEMPALRTMPEDQSIARRERTMKERLPGFLFSALAAMLSAPPVSAFQPPPGEFDNSMSEMRPAIERFAADGASPQSRLRDRTVPLAAEPVQAVFHGLGGAPRQSEFRIDEPGRQSRLHPAAQSPRPRSPPTGLGC